MSQKNDTSKISEIILKSLREYFAENVSGVSLPQNIEISLQLTKDKQFGDVTSNIAMQMASLAKKPPAVIAESVSVIINRMIEKEGLDGCIGKASAKSGFINLWYSDKYYQNLLVEVHNKKADFGRGDFGKGTRVNIEFVSANPTGPLTIAHGRQAAIGDALARIMRFVGYDVTCEYYLNDYGRQINILGKSVEIRYRNILGKDDPMPEDSYKGDYIITMAEEVKKRKGDALLEQGPGTDKYFREFSVEYMMEDIRRDLADFRVSFDVWTSQAGIEDRKEVEKVLKGLEEKGFVFEQEGAKWFASTRLGDDKDRVVIKSDGSYTYLAPDMAYHSDKYRRGFDRLIDLLGPDHQRIHKRMKAAVQAMGHDEKSLDILIVQLVTLLRNGELVRMSTRAGEFVSLRELMDEIGTDVTRFCFLTRRLDSHLDFDIEVAKKESADNPVFYIQYAHARICSIGRKVAELGLSVKLEAPKRFILTHDTEKALMRKLSEFPLAVKISVDILEPSKLVTYLNELSADFHAFYDKCKVITDDVELTAARLYLVEGVKIVLANGLNLLNISLPEKM